MATERQISQTIERCVAAMVRYHDRARSPEADVRMITEVQVVAGFVEELGLAIGEIGERIVRPVEDELVGRYGREDGPRLAARFVGAFEIMGPERR